MSSLLDELKTFRQLMSTSQAMMIVLLISLDRGGSFSGSISAMGGRVELGAGLSAGIVETSQAP